VKEKKYAAFQLAKLSKYILDMGPNADITELKKLVRSIKEVTVEVDDDFLITNSIQNNFALAQNLSSSQILKFNEVLPWSTILSYKEVIQGAPWDEKKRPNVHALPDKHIKELGELIDKKRVLEIGCHEGVYTLGLAKYAKSVVALDGRIDNVMKTLGRVWLANKLDSVNVV